MLKPKYNYLNNLTFIIYFLSLISFLSSSNWFYMWIFLEINMMSFIPLMYNKSFPAQEMISQYFIIQSLSSSMILFFIILINSNLLSFFSNFMLFLSFCMKMGLPPFHFWFILCSENLNYLNFFLLSSMQKILPLFFSQSNMFITSSILILTSSLLILNILISTLACFNETSFRKILAFSSLNHLTWLLLAILSFSNIWLIYLLNYILTLFFICWSANSLNFNSLFSMKNYPSVLKFSFFINILNLSGLPPFLGFFPKILILNFFNFNYFMIFFLLTSSAMFAFIYLRMLNTLYSSIFTPLLYSTSPSKILIFQAFFSITYNFFMGPMIFLLLT